MDSLVDVLDTVGAGSDGVVEYIWTDVLLGCAEIVVEVVEGTTEAGAVSDAEI